MKWNNEVLEQRFNLFNRLIKKGISYLCDAKVSNRIRYVS